MNTQTKTSTIENTEPSSGYEFIMFYDGECPFCQKEIAWLRSLNRQGRLGLYDIHADDFNAAQYAKTHDELMAEIHGLYPDGRLVTGVEVFYAAYHAVGLGWLMAPTRWPVLKPVFTCCYAFFARHRLRWGRWLDRHCTTEKCSVK